MSCNLPGPGQGEVGRNKTTRHTTYLGQVRERWEETKQHVIQLTWARSGRGGKKQNTSCNLPGPGQGEVGRYKTTRHATYLGQVTERGGKIQNTSCNLPGPGQREVGRYKTCQATHPRQVVFSQREVCPGSLCGWFDLVCRVGHALWLTAGRRGGILSLENETKQSEQLFG